MINLWRGMKMRSAWEAVINSQPGARVLSRKYLAGLLSIWFVIMSMAPALALMSTEPDPLMPADEATYGQVVSLLGKDRLLERMDELFIGRVEIGIGKAEKHKFLVARVQNRSCINELCPTLIISNGAQGDKILFSAYLPAKMGIGDTCYYLCEKCGCVGGVYFQDSKGTHYQFGLSGEYAVFGINNLRAE